MLLCTMRKKREIVINFIQNKPFFVDRGVVYKGKLFIAEIIVNASELSKTAYIYLENLT